MRNRALSVAFSTPLALLFALFCVASPAIAQTISNPVPIATKWATVGAAFDGTNWFVPMEDGSHAGTVAGQLISNTGTTVGPVISAGIKGQACCNAVAFDGTNYLMVWEDDSISYPSGTTSVFRSVGQFFNTSGIAAGPSFGLSDGVWLDGLKFLVFGGGKYLFTYVKGPQDSNGTGGVITGRLISPDGSVGSEFRISTGSGEGSSIGFDGSNFFVVWTSGGVLRGRVVSPGGVLGREVSISTSGVYDAGPLHIAFDGSNYLVVFNRYAAANDPNVYGQLVSPNGNLVGGAISISNDPGAQRVMGVAFDGTNYLTAWTDLQATTNWVYGHFISKSGSLVGGRIAISTGVGTQFGGVAGFANGKYLAFVNAGAQMGFSSLLSGSRVDAIFVGPYQPPVPDASQAVASPPADQTSYTSTTGQLPAAAVEVSATGTLGSATVKVTLDLAKVLAAAGGGQFAADSRYNIYVVALAPAGALGLTSISWFQLTSSGAWGALGSPMAAYREGLAQSAVDRIEITILQDANVTALLGTEVYIGYGTSDTEMLTASRYRGVYKVQ